MSAAAFNPYADVVVGIDLEDAYVELQEFEDTANRARAAMLTNLRIAAQTAIYIAQAVGGAISQIYAMLLEGVIIALEVGFAIQGGTFGLANAFQLAQLIFLAQAIRQIKQGKKDAAAKTSQITAGLRLATTIRF